LQLTGGITYLISPTFPLPYSANYGGIGGYGTYFTYLITHTTQLFIPWGGVIAVPEWIHVIVYTLVLVVLCVIFGKFWIELTGQNPKTLAEQLGTEGWQIPGFRRDPRIVENVLNKYIPTLTTLGSIFVGLLAAFATLTGAVGTGMGVLLTVGIIYMLYQQLEQDRLYETYPFLEKIAKS
jgi:preprotein translocase subunit SecY